MNFGLKLYALGMDVFLSIHKVHNRKTILINGHNTFSNIFTDNHSIIASVGMGHILLHTRSAFSDYPSSLCLLMSLTGSKCKKTKERAAGILKFLNNYLYLSFLSSQSTLQLGKVALETLRLLKFFLFLIGKCKH